MGKNASPRLTQEAPYKGLGADSVEKREPANGPNTVTVDSLKALDPYRPIREATVDREYAARRFGARPAASGQE
jgi:hypothetical protein